MTPIVQPNWIPRNYSRSLMNHESFHRFILTAILQTVLPCPTCPHSSCHYHLSHVWIHGKDSYILILIFTTNFLLSSYSNFLLSCSALFKVWLLLTISFCFISIHQIPTLHSQLSCQSKLVTLPITDLCIGIHLESYYSDCLLRQRTNYILHCIPTSSTILGPL